MWLEAFPHKQSLDNAGNCHQHLAVYETCSAEGDLYSGLQPHIESERETETETETETEREWEGRNEGGREGGETNPEQPRALKSGTASSPPTQEPSYHGQTMPTPASASFSEASVAARRSWQHPAECILMIVVMMAMIGGR